MNPYLQVIIVSIIWGSAGVFIKFMQLPSTSVTFFRMIVPLVVVSIYFPLFSHKLKQGSKTMYVISFINAFRSVLYFYAFSLISIGNAVIILYTGPFFTSVFSIFLLKEKVTWKKMALLILSFLGIVVMYSNTHFSFGSKDFLGMTAMLISTISWSVGLILLKKEQNNYSRTETIFYQNLIGAIIFLPFLFINQPFPSLYQASLGTTYAMLSGLIGFMLFFSAMKKLTMASAVLLTYIEVVSAFVFSFLFFHEVPTIYQLVGGSMIILSTYLLKRMESKQKLKNDLLIEKETE